MLANPATQWPVDLVDGTIKFLNRLIERNTKLLPEIMKGPGKLGKFAEASAIIGGNYDAATYLRLSSIGANIQGFPIQQQLTAQIQDCQRLMADLEAIKAGTYVKSDSSAPSAKDVEDPVQVLKLRFAKGEITKAEYDEMLKVLKT